MDNGSPASEMVCQCPGQSRSGGGAERQSEQHQADGAGPFSGWVVSARRAKTVGVNAAPAAPPSIRRRSRETGPAPGSEPGRLAANSSNAGNSVRRLPTDRSRDR